MNYFFNLIRDLKVKLHQRNKIIIDIIWSFLATIIVGVSALLIQTIIGVFFDVVSIGFYSQVIAFYAILTSLGNFGIENSVLKHAAEFSENKHKLKQIYTSALILTAIPSLLIVVITAIIITYKTSIFSSLEVANGLLYCLPGVFFFSLNKNSNIFDSGLRNIKAYSIIRISRWLMIIILLIYFITYNYNFTYVFLSFSIVEFLIFIYFLISHFYFLSKISDNKWFKIHFRYGYTNFLASVISIFSSNLLILISGYYLTKLELGIISFIMTFTISFIVLSSTIQINFNPIFAKKWATNEIQEINILIKKIFKNTLPLFIPVLFFGSIIYYVYVVVFMPVEFKSTFALFFIIFLGQGMFFLFSWPSTILFLAGYIKQNLIRNIILIILNVSMSFCFINLFGINGVVISSILISVSSIIITYYFIKKYLKLDIFNLIKSRKNNV